jgi:hypothetical protein
LDASLAGALTLDYHLGRGTIAWLPVPSHSGKVAGRPAAVYLPPQYGDPRYAHSVFPVVELFTGFAGSPRTWLTALDIQSVLDTAINQDDAVPFIAVMPYSNIAIWRDTECVDVSNGPQVDTYLTQDVRTAVDTAFRAAPGPWGALGYSTGGYCAVNLTLRHPDLFTAAASLAGYDSAAHDRTTGRLFATTAASNQNDDLWRLTHLPDPPVSLLLISTHTDRGPYVAAVKLARDARPPLKVWLLTLPAGGHNAGVFHAELSPAVAWLSRYLSAPLHPIPSLDGLTPSDQFPTATATSTRTRLAIDARRARTLPLRTEGPATSQSTAPNRTS